MEANSNAKYDEYLRKRYLQQQGVVATPDDTVDLSGGPGAGVSQRDWLGNETALTQNENVEGIPGSESASGGSASKGAMSGAQTLAKGGAPEDAISQGLMMSGNPYAMGAGLALQTASSIKKGQNERKQQKYLAEVEKVNARQNAINKMAQIGQGLKA